MAYDLKLHILEVSTGKMLAKPYAWQVPAVGEEVRIAENSYWKVVHVTHCYDEDGSSHRANIGVEKVK